MPGLEPGIHYALRVDGPWAPHEGHRFNRNKVLLDPYAKGNTNNLWDRVASCGPDDNLARSMRSVVVDTDNYDWEGDTPLRRPMSETIVYEMHVGGFTRHPNAGVKRPGTFAGIIEKIPYLKSLGVTAVELLPILQQRPTYRELQNHVIELFGIDDQQAGSDVLAFVGTMMEEGLIIRAAA